MAPDYIKTSSKSQHKINSPINKNFFNDALEMEMETKMIGFIV